MRKRRESGNGGFQIQDDTLAHATIIKTRLASVYRVPLALNSNWTTRPLWIVVVQASALALLNGHFLAPEIVIARSLGAVAVLWQSA